MANIDSNTQDFEKQYNEVFIKPCISLGRATNLIAVAFCFIPALTVYFVYGAIPQAKDILAGWGLIFSIFGIYAVVEPISYFAVLGIPGTYMSFLAGNISNMRMPCAIVAQETLGAEAGTKKSEIIATLSIAGSIITNLIIVTIAAVGGAALMSVFPPIVIEGFKYVTGAIFGAMFAMFASKKPMLGAFALAVVAAMLYTKIFPVYVMILVAVFGTIAFAFMTAPKKS